MTLQEMAAFICGQMGLYDSYSQSLAKLSLNKEYQVLWDKYPWKDAEMTVIVSLPQGQSILDLPAGMSRVIRISATNVYSADSGTPAFKADSRFLDPVTESFIIQTDPTLFAYGGYVKYYSEHTASTAGSQQLKFYPTPLIETSLVITGKAICPGLVNENDTSILRNIDSTLVAYGYFDMLQRQRQYSKAAEKRKEALEFETIAWNLEQQQANQPRFAKTTTVAGNSLLEMTDAVSTICGVWTPEYRLVIREFLRRNYQTLYDTFLWPESLVVVRVAYTNEQVIMPHYIDKVLGIRGANDLRMFPADAGLFLDITPSIFDEIGEPIGYTTLTPVAVAALPATTTALVFASNSPVDIGPVMIRGELIGLGQERIETITLQGTTPVSSVSSYDIPTTISKDITVGTVTVNAATDYALLQTLPSYRREYKHQRLWFLPAPDGSKLAVGEHFTCLVLGKRAIQPLLIDQDTPIITGAQDVLINAAAADLFRKLEKPDMATALLQKTDGLMSVLKAKNTDQAASAPRFVPQIEPHAYTAGCTW